jgi:hypothetical protein
MPAKAGIQNYFKTLDSRLREYDVYDIYLIVIVLLSFPRRSCPSEGRGGNPENGKIRLFTKPQNSEKKNTERSLNFGECHVQPVSAPNGGR